jgi:predicted enzyme related to lactoylglutathione lyase
MPRSRIKGGAVPPTFNELVLRVADLAQEATFFEEGIGLVRLRPAPGEPYTRIAIFDMGGTRLEIHAGGRPLTAPTKREEVTGAIMLKVDDLAAAVERALAHGGSEVMPPTPVPPASMFAYVASPGGLPVGLVEGDSAAYRKALGMRHVPDYWDQPLEG